MNLKGNTINPDALDDLLRKYSLERDPKGLQGEQLLETAANASFSAAPAVVPTVAQEADLIKGLKEKLQA